MRIRKLSALLFAVGCIALRSVNISAVSKTTELLDTSETRENVFITVDKEGNFKEVSMTELELQTQEENRQKWEYTLKYKAIGGTKEIKNGVVNFKTKNSSTVNTSYVMDSTGKNGYTNGYYGADAAFLGYSEDGSKVKFMMAGTVGWVKATEVEILDYNNEEEVKSVNFYRAENGRIYHYATNNIKQPYYWMTNDIGPQQSYMKSNTVYYSYDGHYFYETYEKMLRDYEKDTRENSINPKNPYYNYYQYLSHRTKTRFTAKDLDSYLDWKLSSSSSTTVSKMKDLGSSFIEYQNKYGVNAVLMYGVAINESNYGRSSIAQNKNNLFGHGAVDSNPYYGANGYETPADSVLYHAKVFISEGYLDPCDGSNTYGDGYYQYTCLKGRYYGAHLGDKESGVNVRYASDPYWGEKAARLGWELEKYKENKDIDYNTYQLGIKNGNFVLNVRKGATSGSELLYQAPSNYDVPFIILDEVKGQSVNNSTTWYKIQTDPTLDITASIMIQDSGEYNYEKNVGYVHSSYITKINTKINKPEIEDIEKEEDKTPSVDKTDKEEDTSQEELEKPIPPTDKEETDTEKPDDSSNNTSSGNNNTQTRPQKPVTVVKGDVNGDKKATSADYLMIKDSIMGKYLMNSNQKKAADVNGDGKVSSADYLMIKDSIMGKIKL